MRKIKLQFSLVFNHFLLLSLFLAAADGFTSIPVENNLQNDEKREVVERICKLMEERYVFPEIGKKLSQNLSKNSRDGAYATFADSRKFAEKLQFDLREIQDDKHIFVSFDPEYAKQLRAAEAANPGVYLPSAEELAAGRKGNYGFRKAEILDGNVGLLDLREFFPFAQYAGETTMAALAFIANCDAIIIDLRGNGGGGGLGAFIAGHFFSADQPVRLSDVYSRPDDTTTQNWTPVYIPGKRLPKIPLYILVSNRTFSAAEGFAYNLQALKRATVIGQRTRGGAHPINDWAVNEHFVLTIPESRSINPITKTNWEGTGVKPDIETTDEDETLAVAHQRALEKLIHEAQTAQVKVELQWVMDGVKAKKRPVEVTPAVLKSCAGKYGTREVTFEKGILYYYSEKGRPKMKMIPMAADLFHFNEYDHIRIRFMRVGKKVSGLERLYNNGARFYEEKNK